MSDKKPRTEPTFTLRCVGCKRIETRPARDCREMPFCQICYMPMTLEKVEAGR